MNHLLRPFVMFVTLAAGYAWLAPRAEPNIETGVRFVERAESAGCLNQHSMPQLAPVFENIMPWLSSVGAAAAAADYDNDGDPDLYVTNSGRGQTNRLFRNRGNGTFEDVTQSAGVGCGNAEGGCMHAIWGDVDNDGRLDLYVTKWAATNTLFRNNGDGTFADISLAAGVDYWGYGNAATFLDFDRDGFLDILVANYFAEQVADSKSGQMVRNDLWNPATTRVMHETFTHARNGGRPILYRNRGNNTFEDVAASTGLKSGGWALSVAAGDLNNDGWPDVYIANDFGPDELYVNTGATESNPRYRLLMDPRGHPGIGNDWWKGMNVDMADVNNDGYLDMYVTNIMEKNYKTDEGNMLWLNIADPAFPGGRGFRNIAAASVTQDGGWGWGGKFADFNNDGLLDIFTVNGFATGDADKTYWFQIQEMVTQTKNQTVDAADWPVMGRRDLSGRELSRLFMQVRNADSKGTAEPVFVDVAEASGLTDRFNGRGIAVADYNLDGALDIYIANQGGPSCYYVNQSAPARANSLRLTLTGRPDLPMRVGDRVFASTRNAVGARVVLKSAAGIQTREVQGGAGFASQSEYALHFGVPHPDQIMQLSIKWPSGRVQEFSVQQTQSLIGNRVQITEGDPLVIEQPNLQ